MTEQTSKLFDQGPPVLGVVRRHYASPVVIRLTGYTVVLLVILHCDIFLTFLTPCLES